MPANPLTLLVRELRGPFAPDGDSDCARLARFTRRRDRDAFAALVRRHGPLVLGLCHRWLRRLQDAEDVFQATFLVLARKAASLRKGQALGSWLHGVALVLARKARAADAAPPAAVTARGALEGPDEEVRRLPEHLRTPVLLCDFRGHPQEEAARELGWTKGTLRRRLEHGRALLHARLTGRGLALPGAALAGCAGGPALSAALVEATVWAGLRFVAGKAAASVPVLALAEHGLRALAVPRLRFPPGGPLAFCGSPSNH
jgi:DNA-directed RNA polymerase specialized sigma24 family protein